MAPNSDKLYHMCEAQLWRAAHSSKSPYYPPTYATVRLAPIQIAACSPALLCACRCRCRRQVLPATVPVGCSQDGFIHLSADPGLLLTIANHFYTDSQGDWVVLVLDPACLTAEASAAGAVIELGAKSVTCTNAMVPAL